MSEVPLYSATIERCGTQSQSQDQILVLPGFVVFKVKVVQPFKLFPSRSVAVRG